jgi:negative regulator of flagellin synthesis FlgM
LDKLDRKNAPAKTDNAPETKAPARTKESDSVNLSNVKERIDAQPDFDRAKVDAIKAALQQGNYPVNPRRIAENFVSLEKLIQG